MPFGPGYFPYLETLLHGEWIHFRIELSCDLYGSQRGEVAVTPDADFATRRGHGTIDACQHSEHHAPFTPQIWEREFGLDVGDREEQPRPISNLFRDGRHLWIWWNQAMSHSFLFQGGLLLYERSSASGIRKSQFTAKSVKENIWKMVHLSGLRDSKLWQMYNPIPLGSKQNVDVVPAWAEFNIRNNKSSRYPRPPVDISNRRSANTHHVEGVMEGWHKTR